MRWLAAALAALIACRDRPAAPPLGERVAPALDAALPAAAPPREPWRCAGPDAPSGPDERLVVAGRTWQLAGRSLTLMTAAAGGVAPGAEPTRPAELAIGVVADAAGSVATTLAALGRLRARFGRVDLVVSLGGMGSTAPELGAVFAALADGAPWPLVALPGDLEAVPAQTEAVAAARRRGAAVVDGRLVQRVELPDATIALVPGAGALGRLVAGVDGCRYQPADVAAVLADLAPRGGLRILASAEPPRGDDDPPTGELALAASPDAIDVALYAATGTAATAAHRGARDGSAAAVTPGASDAAPRLGPRRASTAGVLRVQRGATWAWQPLTDRP
jgi:hypothetical protein